MVLFVGLATSNDPDKLKSFAQGVLAKGLTADEKAISERKHDWIRATDFLKREATVPAGISVDFVLAYAGEVNPGTANIISEFEVKDRGGRGAENKAGEGFDLVVLGGQYSFLWMLVLEETGDRTLRRIKKDTDDKLTGRSLLLALFPLSWPDLAEEVLGKAANYAVQVVIENAPKASGEFPTYSIPSVGPVPVDYEYYFASEPGAQQIPLEHKRKWLEDGSISFELRLEAVP